MRYEHEGGDPANAGLQHARVLLEPVKERHPWITYSDLWTLAGAVALEAAGGPRINWQGGRTDYVDDTKILKNKIAGRLPDATQGAGHLRKIFYRMGFNDQEIVALSGAHTLGRCHADRSGFDGPWVNNPTRFSNQYFKLLSTLPWEPKTLPSGIKQFAYYDEDTETELMMLPTDMALLADPGFEPWVRKYGEDKELFFKHFAEVFAKLMELGIERDAEGRITNTDNEMGGYVSAPKKSNTPGFRKHAGDEGLPVAEAGGLEEKNAHYRARL